LAQDEFLWAIAKGRNVPSGKIGWKTLSQMVGNTSQLKIALPPTGSVEAMGACLSAAAEYYQQNNLNAGQINDPAFRSWLNGLAEAAPDRNHCPLDELATRPPQVEIGLIQKSDWLEIPQDLFDQQLPDYNVAFNYPYFIRSNWQDIKVDEAGAHQTAALRFKEYLLSSRAQGKLADYGLSPAGTRLDGQVPLTDEAVIRALRFCWQ
jgi:hypothetical protein